PGNTKLHFSPAAVLLLLLLLPRLALLPLGLIGARIHNERIPTEQTRGHLMSAVLERWRQAVPNLPADFLQRGSSFADGLYKCRSLSRFKLLQKLPRLFGHTFLLSSKNATVIQAQCEQNGKHQC